MAHLPFLSAMLEHLVDISERWIGPDRQSFSLGTGQMVLRAVIVFIIAVVLARIGSRRFMGRSTAFDLILGFMLGSVLSRAITGQSPFFPTLGASAALVAMHSLVALLAYRFHWFGTLAKGEARLLVKDGRPIHAALRRSLVGQRDLDEALRMNAACTSLEEVKLAHLERDGHISVIKMKCD
jgi:uncharacterized membrane protein YcaP (DUF421 family)